jgi:hypothetical protein
VSTNDFIDSLERELRAANQRRVRLELARVARPGAGVVAFAVVLAVCAAVAVPLLATRSGTSAPAHQTVTRPSGGKGVVVGCQRTVYGRLPRDWQSTQAGTAVIGPIAWVGLARAVNPAAINRSHFIEAPAVVSRGEEVTVSIPSSERNRVSLDYTNVGPRSRFYLSQGASSVTFKPCLGATHHPAGLGRVFEGGFIVSGPQCARVDVVLASTTTYRRQQSAGGTLGLTNFATYLSLGRSCPGKALEVLSGNGIGQAHFGEGPSTVVNRLRDLLGRGPTKPYQRANVCRIDGEVGWPGLAVYFRHRRFVGYSYSGPQPGRSEPVLGTLRGLQVGDRLTRGRQLYGSAFEISAAQGGGWLVRTPQGRIFGYTSDVTNLRGKVVNIDAGYVGCPSLTPS